MIRSPAHSSTHGLSGTVYFSGVLTGQVLISSSGQVCCLSRRVPCFHGTLSGKNCQPLQAATSDTYPHLAGTYRRVSTSRCTAHKVRGIFQWYASGLYAKGIGHFWLAIMGTSRTIGKKCSTTTDTATTNTSMRDSTHGESSAWRTKMGGWHPCSKQCCKCSSGTPGSPSLHMKIG